jgi:hypothetical protein
VITSCDFPLQLSIQDHVYHLQGVVVHRGGVDAGHYISFIRDDSKQWHCYNDTAIARVSEQQMLKECRNDGYLLFYQETEPFLVEMPASLQQKVNADNLQLHIRRIIYTDSFFRAMEEWAKTGSTVAVEYLFRVLPYCAEAIASKAGSISAKLIAAELGTGLQKWMCRPILACPIVEMRQAGADVFLFLFRKSPSADIFGEFYRILVGELFLSMDIGWSLLHRIMTEFDPMRVHMIENRLAKQTEDFLMRKIPQCMANQKNPGLYTSLDFTHLLKVIVVCHPSQEFCAFCLNPVFLEGIIRSKTDLMAIVELLKAFEDQRRVLHTIQECASSTGKADLYEVIIQKLVA